MTGLGVSAFGGSTGFEVLLDRVSLESETEPELWPELCCSSAFLVVDRVTRVMVAVAVAVC
jgi:hypothetical protein